MFIKYDDNDADDAKYYFNNEENEYSVLFHVLGSLVFIAL